MKISNPLKYATIFALTGILASFSVIYVKQKTISINKENQPLIALVEHVKNKSASAHIWFEKAMKRDKSIVLEKDMYQSLDATLKLFKQVLDGGETELGVFHKTTNIEIYNTVNQLLLNTKDIKFFAIQRMKFNKKPRSKKKEINSAYASIAKDDEIGKALDRAFDESYEKLQGNYENLAKLIKMKIEQDNNVLNYFFWISISLIIVVFTVFSFLFYKILKSESLARNALILSEKRFQALLKQASFDAKIKDSHPVIIHNPESLEINSRKV